MQPSAASRNLFAYVAFEKHITVLGSEDEVAKTFSFFQFKRYALPPLYWRGMLTGRL